MAMAHLGPGAGPERLWCWQMTQEGNAMLWDALILLGLAILVAVTLGGLVYVGPVALLGAPRILAIRASPSLSAW
jgi:hypothetical protein